MSGIDYLADTNALIYLLAGNECMKPYLDKRLAVSVISYMEILSFSGIDSEEEKNIREFLDNCIIIGIEDGIREKTISIRRERKVKLPDSIIAATAILYGIPLLTADVGFNKIVDLNVVELKP
jgi:predicted nucleic acid-binding protein